jgi:hypothetical protein
LSNLPRACFNEAPADLPGNSITRKLAVSEQVPLQ